MRDLKAHDFMHAVRSYMSELECEHPDMSIVELRTALADSQLRLSEITKLGGSPAQAARMTLAEQIKEGVIPPWV